MEILIMGLIVLTVIAMIVGKVYYHRIDQKVAKGEIEEAPQLVEVDSECCGQHEVCEKDSLLAALSKGIEYYNDEELDRFRFREPDDYTEDEVEEFREVMFTCREDEVAGWCRSLQLRNIAFPEALKDELFLIIGERRFNH